VDKIFRMRILIFRKSRVIHISMNNLSTVSDVIDAFGSFTKVAAASGLTVRSVETAKYRGYFPPKSYVALRAALERLGHRAPDTLWRMAQPK
jgi:hypothetical protein